MLSEKLLSSLAGSVCFYVQGGFLPRFLSLCADKNVRLLHTRQQEDRLYATVRRYELADVQAAAGHSGMNFCILKKRGLSFLLHRYRLRLGIPVGICLALALFALLSSMVWQVEVIGCEKLSEEHIASYFNDLGVRTGVLQSSIDIRRCREKAMLEMPGLLWVTVYLKGCTAYIELVERNAEVTLPKQGSSNLVASYGGEIVRADVYAGESYVKIGQAVAKGDLLVGGALPLKNGGVRFVRSQADVVARTSRVLQTSVGFAQSNMLTQKARTRYVLDWFGLKIPLGLRFGFSVAESTVLQPEINGVRLPVKLCRQGLRKQVQKQVQCSEELALLQCFSLFALQETQEMQDKKVCERVLSVQQTDSGIAVCGSYVCEENIVQEQELQLDAEN